MATLRDEMISFRRHLHAHPELSFREHATAAFVERELERHGIAYKGGAARLGKDDKGTGVIAWVRGEASPSERCFALRADLDALPITEVEGRSYGSTQAGVMHACGHDAHTAMVLGAGIALHRLREHWAGTVVLVFQPGEEKEPGGASLLVKEGVLNDPKPSGIMAQHVTPELATGKLGFRAGPFMAAADELYLTVRGKGGHAAVRPTLVDPILITAKLLPALYDEAERHTPAGEPMIVSFGKVLANGATNIVPDTVSIEGTLRTFNENTRSALHAELARAGQALAKELGGDLDFRIVKGSPVVKNDPDLTARMRAAAEQLLGAENVVEMPIRMGAEDFAYYTHVMPGCFYRLGTGNPGKPGSQSGLHTSGFDIDEDALMLGATMMAWGAISEVM